MIRQEKTSDYEAVYQLIKGSSGVSVGENCL